MAHHRFSRTFDRLLGVRFPLTCYFHTILFFLSTMHLFLCISVSLFGTRYHILPRCFRSCDLLPIYAVEKCAQIPKKQEATLGHPLIRNNDLFCTLIRNRVWLTEDSQRHTAGASFPLQCEACASLESPVAATRLPGLSCQDLTCLPEDKAITGGGVGDGVFEKTHTETSPYFSVGVPKRLCSLSLNLEIYQILVKKRQSLKEHHF